MSCRGDQSWKCTWKEQEKSRRDGFVGLRGTFIIKQKEKGNKRYLLKGIDLEGYDTDPDLGTHMDPRNTCPAGYEARVQEKT